MSESTRRGRPCQEKCRAGGHTARWRAYREGPRRFRDGSMSSAHVVLESRSGPEASAMSIGT